MTRLAIIGLLLLGGLRAQEPGQARKQITVPASDYFAAVLHSKLDLTNGRTTTCIKVRDTGRIWVQQSAFRGGTEARVAEAELTPKELLTFQQFVNSHDFRELKSNDHIEQPTVVKESETIGAMILREGEPAQEFRIVNVEGKLKLPEAATRARLFVTSVLKKKLRWDDQEIIADCTIKRGPVELKKRK